MSTETPYDANFGAGGKFRKQPNRRAAHHSKPYDRPPPPKTAIRTQIGSVNNGWISKLVDPAHRLITASARRLFGSVFQKRLTQPPPNVEPTEISQEEADQYQDPIPLPNIVSPGVHEATTGCSSSKNFSDTDGITELEQLFKQKTFTRSEIDHLTALLHSKTVDMSVEDGERRTRAYVSSDSRYGIDNTPLPQQENGDDFHLTSTPAVRRIVDEDAASPADLAKAYMGSKTSKVSPSKLGLRSQAMKDDPNMLGIQHFPQKSPRMALMPRSAVNGGIPNNSHIIASRPRGRSAIYSMARTPYAMVNSVSASKRAGHIFDTDAGSSSGLPTWNGNKLSASKHGSLKRRSSFLENDIGSVGPIRRIRQKHNLLSSRKSSPPVPGSSLSVPRLATGGDGGDALRNSSGVFKSQLSLDTDDNIPKELRKNGNFSSSIPGSAPVSSKSSEMASKILQQLDKLVSSKEKLSPTKTSASMLNDSGKDLVQRATVETAGIKSFAHHTPKNQAFQMSAHEVSQELDDHSYHNGVMSSSSLENKGKLIVSETDGKDILANRMTMEPNPADIEIEPPASSNVGIFDGAMTSRVSAGFAIPSASSCSADPVASASKLTSMKESSFDTPVFGFGDKAGMRKEPDAVSPPPMTFGDNVAPPKEASISPIINEANSASSMFSFGSKDVVKAPEFSMTYSNSVAENSGPKASASSITETVGNDNKSEGTADNKRKTSSALFTNTSESAFPSLASKSTLSAGISPFAASVNGVIGTTSSSPPVTSLFPHTGTGQSAPSSYTLTASAPASTTNNTSDNNNSSTFNGNSSNGLSASSVSDFPSTPVFKFASATTTCPDAKLGAETRPSTSFSTPSSSPFQSTPAVADTGSSIFGFTGPSTKSPVNVSQGSSTFSFGSAVATSAFSAKAVGPVTSSQSMPNQFGSSASVPSFSFGGNSSLSTSSSLSGSSASGAKLFNGGNPFGQSSASSLDATAAASMQPAKSPFVGSVFSSPSGFSFGPSSATASSTAPTASIFSSSTGFAFGSSSSTASNASGSSTGSSMFSFTSSMPSTSSQPVFNGTNSTAFCSNPLPSNDQNSMEDGMAEDTVHAPAAAPNNPVFGQQTISPQPSAFVFGSSAPSSSSPFQFGSQQSPSTPQNPVAFQAQGNVGFNAAGASFSLGTGGGDKSKRKIIKVRRGRK